MIEMTRNQKIKFPVNFTVGHVCPLKQIGPVI